MVKFQLKNGRESAGKRRRRRRKMAGVIIIVGGGGGDRRSSTFPLDKYVEQRGGFGYEINQVKINS